MLADSHRLHNDKVHKADVLDNAVSKIVSERLPNLDSIPNAQVWDLTGLDCKHTTKVRQDKCIAVPSLISFSETLMGHQKCWPVLDTIVGPATTTCTAVVLLLPCL